MKKPSFKVASFGKTKYGEKAKKFTLNGAGGVVMEVSDYGGKIIKLFTPDRMGKMKDIVVGFDSPAGWDNGDPYWGCIIGRYGNRIAKGAFKLNGKKIKLPALNNAPAGIGCNLHGGARGWNAYVWDAKPFVKGTDVGVVFTHVSPDGDEGFPGRVEVKVTYTLTAKNVWRVEYEAVPDKDTPINMTQHVYFNFKGEAGGTIEDHILRSPRRSSRRRTRGRFRPARSFPSKARRLTSRDRRASVRRSTRRTGIWKSAAATTIIGFSTRARWRRVESRRLPSTPAR